MTTTTHQAAEPDCSCETCEPNVWPNLRFIVCAICGNKRCPHANDHRNACTNSNESGQPGSAYPAVARGIECASTTTEGRGPEGDEPGAACGTRPEPASTPEQRALERDAADMFWDFDDGERMAHDITEIVADYGVGSVVKIDQAKRLPSITVRVIEGESGENDWEPIDADQQAGKGQP